MAKGLKPYIDELGLGRRDGGAQKQTVGATSVTIASWAMPASSMYVAQGVYVMAVRADAGAEGDWRLSVANRAYIRVGAGAPVAVRDDGGGLFADSVVGSESGKGDGTVGAGTIAAASLALSPSGNTINLVGTGVAGATIDWYFFPGGGQVQILER